MSKPKFNTEEFAKDMDKFLSLMESLDNVDLKNLNVDRFEKKAEILKQEIEKKYSKYLDSKK